MSRANLEKIVFICNPAAGKGEAVAFYKTFRSFLSPETECRYISTRLKDSGQLGQVLKEGFSTFIVAGGDGTVHEFINELFPYSGDILLGVIPVGTGNDLARSLMNYNAFLKNPVFFISELAGSLSKSSIETRKGVVLSTNNEIYWTCYMGVGFDGQVIKSFHRYRNFHLPNKLIYLFAVLKTLLQEGRVPVCFLDKKGFDKFPCPAEQKLFQLLLLNISSYGGGMIQSVKPGSGNGFRVIGIKSVMELLVFFIKNRFLAPFKNTLFLSEHMEFETDNLIFEIPGHAPVQIDGEDYSKNFEAGGINHVKKAGEITLILQ